MAYKVTRGLFTVFNLINILLAIALIGVGAYLFVNKNHLISLLSEIEDAEITAVLIAVGVFCFVVSVIGFVGAWRETQCLLIIFFVAMVLLYVAEISVGITGFVFKHDIDKELNTQLKEGIQEEARKPSWDTVQKEFECCGVDNYEDWYGSNDGRHTVPDSCCSATERQNCGNWPQLAYDVGCYALAKKEMEERFYLIGVCGVVVAVLQTGLIVMSMVLICAIHDKRTSAS